jgi:SAM-dependent methyltransferase
MIRLFHRMAKSDQLRTTPLCEIMTRHGSDKGVHRHNYTVLYDFLFGLAAPGIRRVFELGLGSNNPAFPFHMGNGMPGASLRGWAEYFPRAEIFGADIDRDVLFTEPRIQTFGVDQFDRKEARELFATIGGDFDLILDDGCHVFGANATFLETAFARLRPGGLYIIEDIALDPENIATWKQFLAAFREASVLLELKHPANGEDNAVVILQNQDFPAA